MFSLCLLVLLLMISNVIVPIASAGKISLLLCFIRTTKDFRFHWLHNHVKQAMLSYYDY